MTEMTQERLRELLHYAPETGVWTWLVTRKVRAGSVAGTPGGRGYIQIRIDYKRYLAHRLAFLYTIGRWPLHQVDHRDRDRSNNCWDNLREATHQQNCWNRSDALGVSWDDKRQKWSAWIWSGKTIFLGRFPNFEDACIARRQAEVSYRGEFLL